MSICVRCGKEILGKTIILSDEGIKGTYCTNCYNQIASEYIGIDIEKVLFEPIQIKDAYGKNHIFYFENQLNPTGISIEAMGA